MLGSAPTAAPIPVQDALLVALQLGTTERYDIWEDGKRLDCLPVTRGMVNIYDLKRSDLLNDLDEEVVLADIRAWLDDHVRR